MLPPNYILDEIRHLKGKARITFPGQKTDVFKVERILTLPKTQDWKADYPYYSPDQEYSTAVLIARELIKQDNQYIEVYLAWHVLPGVILDGVETEPETTEQLTVTRQIVAGTTALPSNSGGIVWEKQPIDDVVDIHVKRDYSSLLGKRWETFPNISYTFPGLLTFRGGVLTESRQPASYRAAFSRIVRARVVVYFTAAAEDLSEELFEPYAVNIRSDAGNFSNVLHNVRSAVIGGRRQQVEESFPSSSEYPIGEEVLIRAPSDRTSFGLYRNELTYIRLL